jgi:hypothetical protein
MDAVQCVFATRRRSSRRWFGAMILLPMVAGCAPEGRGQLSATRARPAARAVAATAGVDRVGGVAAPNVLAAPEGASKAVEVCWGGPISGRRLGVRFADGRFALYQPDRASGPISVSPGGEGPPLRALAVAPSGQVATGDATGVTVWDTDNAVARLASRLPAPAAVDVLVVEPGDEGALWAGLADGRLARFRLRAGESTLHPLGAPVAVGSDAAVRELVWAEGGRALWVRRADGSLGWLRRDLSGPSIALGRAVGVAAASGPERLARVVAGPALVLDAWPGTGLSRRIALPGAATSVAFSRGGSLLWLACADKLLLIDLAAGAPRGPAEVRVVMGIPGPVRLAPDPGDPRGRRLAWTDAAGRVTVGDAEELAGRAVPWSLDDAAELAFWPQRRFYRPRPGAPDLELARPLERRIAAARAALDRGASRGLLSTLRDLENDPGLNRRGAAEVLTMIAAVEQDEGWTWAAIGKVLERARVSFERGGRTDRAADMRFWQAVIQIPALDGTGGDRPARQLEEALGPLRRAAALYRACDPPLTRQALLCEALRAWTLLNLGEIRAASGVLRPVLEAANSDAVLGQVVELDRIAAALAAARGNWPASAAALGQVLNHPSVADRPGLHRAMVLEQITTLAALDRWAEAAALVADERPDDPEWQIRRGTVRRRAGLNVVPVARTSEDDHRDAHLRGRLAAARGVEAGPGRRAAAFFEEARAELATAAAAYRCSGQDALAIEADLERAEVLERLGRPAEAAALYVAVIRQLGLGAASERVELARWPLRAAVARPYRGLARCQLALGRVARALTALEGAEYAQWCAQAGEDAIRTTSLGQPAHARATADALRDARALTERLGGPGASDEADAAWARVRPLAAMLKTAHAPLVPADPALAFDTGSLALTDTEAALVLAPVGPEAMVGVLVRGAHPPEAHLLPASRSALRSGVRAWRGGLGDGGRDLHGADPPRLDALLSLAPEPDPPLPAQLRRPAPGSAGTWEAYLDQVLIHPFASGLLGVTHLTIVPHDALGALPFEVLGRPERLLQRMSVFYVPSLAILRALRSRSQDELPSGSGTLILAVHQADGVGAARPSWATVDDLRVLAAIHRAGGWNPELALGPAAHPGRLLAGPVGALRVIHLAAATTLDPGRAAWGDVDHRLAPGAPGPRGDGRLTASDLLAVPLRAAVVTLAFGTPADRAMVTGPGVREIARGWLAAGARAVVLPLWDPPVDSGPRLLAELHRAIASGASPAAALETARLALARDPRFHDPVHWAGFVLYGVP